jgi:NAD-dependent aldehyde dehydrogenases
MPLTLQRNDLLRSTHYIGGRWCEAAGGERYEIEDPALARAFASVPDGTADDARAALEAAHAASPRGARCLRATALASWPAGMRCCLSTGRTWAG